MTDLEMLVEKQKLRIMAQEKLIDAMDESIDLLKERCDILYTLMDKKDEKVDAVVKALKTKAAFLDTAEEEMAYRLALEDFSKLYKMEAKDFE